MEKINNSGRPLSPAELGDYQQSLLVPLVGGKKTTIVDNPVLKPVHQQQGIGSLLLNYPAAIVATCSDTIARSWGLAFNPEQLFSEPIKSLQKSINSIEESKQDIINPSTLANFSTLANYLNTEFGPIRDATTAENINNTIENSHATRIELFHAVKLATKLSNTESDNQLIQQKINEIIEFNQRVTEASLKEYYIEEETRRHAHSLNQLFKDNQGSLEVFHIPPKNLITAALIAKFTYLGSAIMSALFKNELKKTGLTVILEQDSINKQMQYSILKGGPGKGKEVIPADSQSEWDQPLAQEIASDTIWGKKLFRFWGTQWKNLLKLRLKHLHDKPIPLVEAGTFSLISNKQVADRVDFPIIITKHLNQKSTSGGAQFFDDIKNVIKKANDLIDQAQQITYKRMNDNDLPKDLPESFIPVTANKEESLKRAQDLTIRLITLTGTRPDMVVRLAKIWLKGQQELNKSNKDLNIENFFAPKQPLHPENQEMEDLQITDDATNAQPKITEKFNNTWTKLGQKTKDIFVSKQETPKQSLINSLEPLVNTRLSPKAKQILRQNMENFQISRDYKFVQELGEVFNLLDNQKISKRAQNQLTKRKEQLIKNRIKEISESLNDSNLSQEVRKDLIQKLSEAIYLARKEN